MAVPTAIRAGRAFVELFADDSMLVRTLRRAESQVMKFGNHLKTIGRRLMTLGLAASVPFAASVKSFAAFDDMMRAVKAAVGATEKEFDNLTAKAKTLGRTTSFTAVQVAAAMLELARAGFNPKNIDVAIAALLDLARATGTELALATEIAVNSMYSFELTATDMTRVCDVMVAAANGAAMTLEDLGYSMSYCAPIAKEYGITLEDTCKIIGALSNYGIKASQAGTTFRRILTNLADADIQKRLRGFGVEAVDVDTGKMREVSAVLRDLGRATERMPKDKKLTLFKELFGLWAIAGGAKLTVAQFDYLIEEIDKASGTAKRTAQEMDAGIGGSLRRLWAVIEGVAIAVGGALAPSLKQLTDWWRTALGGVVAYLDKHKEFVVETVKTITTIIGIGAALLTLGFGFLAVAKMIGFVAMSIAGIAGVILSVFGLIGGVLNTLRFAVGSFVAVLGGIISAIVSVVSVIVGVVQGVAAVFLTIGHVVVAVMAVVARVVFIAIALIVRNLFFLIRAVIAIVTFIVPILTTIIFTLVRVLITIITLILAALMPIITALLTAIAPLIATCITSFTLIAAAVAGAIMPIVTLITSSFIIVAAMITRAVAGIIASLLPPITAFFTMIAAAIGTVITTLILYIGLAVSFVCNIILLAVSVIASAFASLIALASIAIAGVIQIIAMFITYVLTAMAPISVVIATIIGSVLLMIFTIQTVLINLNRIVAVLYAVLNGLANIVTGCFDLILTLIIRFIALLLSPFIALFSWIISGLWNLVTQIGSILVTAIGNIVSSIRSAFTSAWNGIVTIFNNVFSILQAVLAGFGNFCLNVFNNIGIAIDWLRERFGTLCSYAIETYSAIVAALGRGDIEAVLGVLWATLKLIWVQGVTSLLSTWYWLIETLQTAWTVCVFKIAEILTIAWYGVQQFWTETVYTMMTLWTEFSNGIIAAWKQAERAIAHGIGWIMAKIEGIDPNDMANLINQDYNYQSQQREADKTRRLNEIDQNRNTKAASLQHDQDGVLANLKADFANAANARYPEHEAKIAAQEQELAQAKAAYWEAINRAKNPPPNPEGTEPESLTEKLNQKVSELSSGMDLGNKISVTGSFSAAAIQTMGMGSVMDRVAKATEKSEKHLEKIANKDTKTESKNDTKKKQEQNKIYEGDVPLIKELQQQTRFLRDISEKGSGQQFA